MITDGKSIAADYFSCRWQPKQRFATHTWTAPEWLKWFLECCWDMKLAANAKSLLYRYTKEVQNSHVLQLAHWVATTGS